MAINNPVLYWRDDSSKTISLESLISSKPDQVIQFENGTDDTKAQIEVIEVYGDENTIEEPEINSTGAKAINKQNAGALPEGIKISGNIDISESTLLAKLRTFYRKIPLIEDSFDYGIFGFYSNVSNYFDLNPTNEIGYTMKPPTITWNAPNKYVTFEFYLILGARQLV